VDEDADGKQPSLIGFRRPVQPGGAVGELERPHERGEDPNLHDRHRVERQRAAGLTEIAGVRISLPMGVRPDAALMSLAERRLISLRTFDGDRPSLVLTIARVDGGPPRKLSLPKLVWL
jgi:hypothetical protein